MNTNYDYTVNKISLCKDEESSCNYFLHARVVSLVCLKFTNNSCMYPDKKGFYAAKSMP